MKRDDANPRDILRRAEADQRGLLTPGPPLAGEPSGDAAEIWGRRVGRVLGYALLLLLIVNLFTGWFF